MSVVRIEAELSFDKLLNAVEQLSLPELEDLMSQVMTLQAKRKAPCLSADETELMLKINQGLSPDMQTRFDELVGKRQAETLTQEEHQELLALTDQIEKADAERMKYLAELARIRGISLDVLMEALEIHPPAYA
jgi:hypothetical protein